MFCLLASDLFPAGICAGFNVVRHCTGQLPFLANGAAVYGGESNGIEDCLFTDISSGCGVLLSTTFPTANAKQNIDNNFSGTTVIKNCDLVRCGGFDHARAWRAALQIYLDRRSISGVHLSHLNIEGSISDGLSIVASDNNRAGAATLSTAQAENLNIPNYGIGVKGRHGLWIGNDTQGSIIISGSTIVESTNGSPSFTIH